MSLLKREVSEDSLIQVGPRSEYVKRYPAHPVNKTKSLKPKAEVARGSGKVESVTTTRQDFPEHPLHARTSYRPNRDVVKADGVIESETVTKHDYPEHPVFKRQAAKPAEGNLRSEGAFDFHSSYRDQFHDAPAERRKPFKPVSERPDLGAFDAEPSYRSDYPERQLPERRPRHKETWHPPEQPFVGDSTNMNDFKEHQISPRINYKPANNTVQSDQPFAGSSDYKDTYREHPIVPKQPREREVWNKPTEPFEGVTTQQKDFQGNYVPQRRSMRPDREPVVSDVPLDDHTTHGVDYKRHELPKRYKHEAEPYQKPEGPMDLTTTNATNYVEHPTQRQSYQKPGSSQLLRGHGEMAKHTNYEGDYIEHPINRTSMIKPKNEYEPPTVPMDSDTVNRSDYQQHQITPRKNYRPRDVPMHSDQPFEDRTDYRDTFKTHEIQPRKPRVKEVYTGPKAPLDARTTVRDSYLGPYQPKRESFKPDRYPVQSDAPFEGATTMHNDYQQYEVKRPFKHQPDPYQKPEGVMDLATTHTTNYKEMPLQRQTIKKPSSSQILRGEGMMSKDTNYQGSFIPHPIEQRKNMKPQNTYVPPADKMDSDTTHRADFFEKGVNKRQSFRPSNKPMMSDVPFDDTTGYRATFTNKELPRREARVQESYKPPSAPFEARTTVRDSYQGAYQPMRHSFRPDRAALHSDAPFDGSTTMNNDFKEYNIPERQRHMPEAYHKPEGAMDLTTTHVANYTGHQVQRQNIQKPGSSQILKGHGEMRKDTNYQGDFKQPPPVKRQLVKPKHDYIPPVDPMEMNTTAQISYTEKELSKRTNFKPLNNPLHSDAPFEDRTDYRDRFTQHEVSPRQARPKEVHHPPSAPLDARTTNRDTYLGAYQEKRSSFRPDRNVVKSDIPMENNTTSGNAFKPWQAQPRQRHRPEEYKKPDGYMDLTTMHRETFKEVRGERPTIRRLGSSHLLTNAGKFEDKTSYGGDYVPKSLEGRKLVKPTNEYVPSSIPFDDSTEYRTKLIGYVAPKEKSFKPLNARSDTLGQRDEANKYRIRDFVSGPPPPVVPS